MADQESVSSFSFQALGLGSVLKLNRLSVPLYQREYAWKEEKVEQLLRDLQRAKDDQTDYFLGTIVTIPKPNTEVLNVVDGQQRITTTAIFLAGIRDYVLKQEPDSLIVESIENEFLTIRSEEHTSELQSLMRISYAVLC